MRVQIIWVALVFGGLLFYSGIGLVRLLTFDRIGGGEFVLAPAAGFALLVSVGSWNGWLGWSAGVALAIALGTGTILNLLALRVGRGRPLDLTASLGGMLLAGLVFTVAVTPLWKLDRPATVVGLNGDQVLYVNLSSHLARHGLPFPAPGALEPAATQLWFLNYGVPLGFGYVHAMVDRLTGQPAYETFSVVTAVFLALGLLPFAFLAERAFGLGRRWALAAGLMAAASPMLMWLHYNDYAMHVLAVSLAPAAFAVTILALEEGRGRGLIFASLLLSAIFVSYPFAAAPFLLAPLGVYALLLAWRGSAPGTVFRRCAVLGLAMAAVNLAGLVHVVKVLRPMLGFILVKEFGDVLSHVSWAQLFGLVHHALPPPPNWATSVATVLAATAALLACYGAAGTTPEGRRAFLALFVTTVPFLLWLRYGLDYPYGFYKGLTFLVSPVLVALLLGVRRAMSAPAMVRGSALALLLALVVTSGANLLRTSQTVTIFDLAPMVGLRELTRLVPRDQAIHVRDESGTALLWVTYFLRDRSLYLANYSPYYLHRGWPFYQEAITAPLVLVNRDAARLTPWEAGTVYENSRYRMVRKDPAILAHFDVGAMRLLEAGSEFRVALGPDRTIFDGRSLTPGLVTADGQTVSLGLFAVNWSTLRLHSNTGQPPLRAIPGRELVSWPASPPPSEVTIVNAGTQPVLVAGWIEVGSRELTLPGTGAAEGPLKILREEILPKSGFFAVSGWHGREPSGRWSQASGVAVFRNPRRTSSLRIDGALLEPGSPPIEAVVRVNGQTVCDVMGAREFSKVCVLPETLLGEASWGILDIRVNRVFVPKAAGISADDRDLGVLVRALRIEPSE